MQLFYVFCPECTKRFYAEYATMYKTGAEFHCPFCHHRFKEGLREKEIILKGGGEYVERSEKLS